MTKYLGLISVSILTVGLLFTVLRWKGGMHMTFSQHVARYRIATVYYSALFTISLPLLYVFFANWFVPTFELPQWFLWFVAISIVFQILCTFVPEVGGWKTIVHRILTAISGVALLPLIAAITLTPSFSVSGRVITTGCLIGMLVLLSIAFMNQRGYRYSLLLQVGYYALFFAPILYLTYT